MLLRPPYVANKHLVSLSCQNAIRVPLRERSLRSHLLFHVLTSKHGRSQFHLEDVCRSRSVSGGMGWEICMRIVLSM